MQYILLRPWLFQFNDDIDHDCHIVGADNDEEPPDAVKLNLCPQPAINAPTCGKTDLTLCSESDIGGIKLFPGGRMHLWKQIFFLFFLFFLFGGHWLQNQCAASPSPQRNLKKQIERRLCNSCWEKELGLLLFTWQTLWSKRGFTTFRREMHCIKLIFSTLATNWHGPDILKGQDLLFNWSNFSGTHGNQS